MKKLLASLLNRVSARAEITILSHHFRTAVEVGRTQPYDGATYDYAVNQLNAKIRQIFAPVSSTEAGRVERDQRNNLELDYWHALRMARWIEKVGPQTMRPYDERVYELYLKTISNSAEATTHGMAPNSNWALARSYAGLLPMAAACSHLSTDKSWHALDIYMGELAKVWEAAAFYKGHKSGMARELVDQINISNARGLWGEEANPRFGEYRAEVLRLLRT